MNLKSQDNYYRYLLCWNITNFIMGSIFMILGSYSVPFSLSSIAQEPIHFNHVNAGFGLLTAGWGALGIGISSFKINEIWHKIYSLNYTENKENRNEADSWGLNILIPVIALICGFILVMMAKENLLLKGIGWGIALQSIILLVFEIIYNIAPDKKIEKIETEKFFKGPKHKEFLLKGEKKAALLVHSLTGSPYEMRNLAQELKNNGFTAKGLALPGLGKELSELQKYSDEDWTGAIKYAAKELKKNHESVVLVGYSTSCPLCINAGQSSDIDAIILISPVICREGFIDKTFHMFLPNIFQPFEKAQFSKPELSKGLKKVMPDINTDDKKVINAIRNFTIPLTVINEVKKSFEKAFSIAGTIKKPVLIVTSKIPLSIQERTEELLSCFSKKVIVKKINTTHDLILQRNPEWSDFAKSIKGFIKKTNLVF